MKNPNIISLKFQPSCDSRAFFGIILHRRGAVIALWPVAVFVGGEF